MSDTGNSPTLNIDPTAENQSPALPVLIHAQYIRDLSFENPNAPLTLQPNSPTPNVHVQIDVKTRSIGDRMIEVSLELSINAKADERVVFLIELNYAGLFEITEAAGPLIDRYVSIEAPAHLFPFARAVVANVTRDGGYPPLLINPIDFGRLYQQRQAESVRDVSEKADTEA